jgi:hypothetical protein
MEFYRVTNFTDNFTGPPKSMEQVEKFGFGSRTGAWWKGWNSPESVFRGRRFRLILGGMYDT